MNQCDCRCRCCCCCVRHSFYYLQHRSYQTKFRIFGMACEPGYTKVQTITSLSNGFRLSFVSFAPWWWITKTIISLFKSIQAGHLGVFVFFLSSISWVSCVIVISTTHLAVIWAVIFDNINWNHSSLLCDDPKTIIKDEKKEIMEKLDSLQSHAIASTVFIKWRMHEAAESKVKDRIDLLNTHYAVNNMMCCCCCCFCCCCCCSSCVVAVFFSRILFDDFLSSKWFW